PDVKSLALACIPEIKRLADDRALAVHGLWLHSHTRQALSAGSEKNPQRNIDISELERLYSEVANLSNAIMHVWHHTSIFRGEPSPWRDKWLQGSHPCPRYSPYPPESTPRS